MSIQKTVWGNVDANGKVTQGHGFTCKPEETGLYTITYTSPFGEPPSVFAQLWDNGKPLYNARVSNVTAGWCQVITGDSSGTWQNCPFSFQAVGMAPSA